MTPREIIRTVVPPLLLAALTTAFAYAATGPTTGFFFAGVVIATLLIPPLVLAETTRLRQLLCAAGIIDGVGIVWLFSVPSPAITLWDWVRCYALLISYSLALSGAAALLSRLRLRTPLASAVVTLLALSWLAWPVWLSPWIAGHERIVGALVVPHPLLALDGVFRSLGPAWSERYFMYNFLSVLNQDVAYELPRSVMPAVLLHGTIGAIALLLTRRAVRLEVDVPDGSRRGGGEERVGEDLLPE